MSRHFEHVVIISLTIVKKYVSCVAFLCRLTSPAFRVISYLISRHTFLLTRFIRPNLCIRNEFRISGKIYCYLQMQREYDDKKWKSHVNTQTP